MGAHCFDLIHESRIVAGTITMSKSVRTILPLVASMKYSITLQQCALRSDNIACNGSDIVERVCDNNRVIRTIFPFVIFNIVLSRTLV